VTAITLSGMFTGPSGLKKPNKIKRNPSFAACLVVGLLAIIVVLLFSYWAWSPISRGDSSHSTLSANSSAWPFDWTEDGFSFASHSGADSPVYPYSVIPGGIASAKKLQTALRHDPVAATHYANFRVQSARLIRLGEDRRVYVSYRIADHIYWTRKKVALHAGETLLTDGTHLVRARCGNRISDVPAKPTSPSEPPNEVLNRPVQPLLPVMPTDALPGDPVWKDTSTPPLLAFDNPPKPNAPGGGGPFVPFLPGFPIPCCGGSPGPSPSPGPLPQPYPVPPVATPEPGTLSLLLIGVAGLVSLMKLRRS